MASTVGQYCINVTDLARSEWFYTEIIGLKVQSRTQIPGVDEIVLAADAGGGRLQLAKMVRAIGTHRARHCAVEDLYERRRLPRCS